MKKHNNITDDELLRYVDGELDVARADNVAQCIATDVSLQKKVADYEEINRRLEVIYNEHQHKPVPARLLLAVSNRSPSPIWRMAASVLLLLLGGVIGYSLQITSEVQGYERPLPVEAAFAHTVYVPEVRHPVEVGADETAHMNAWLSKRLDRVVAAPDLRSAGYALVGGRLLPDGHRAAAQFMFEDNAGGRITLFIRQSGDRPDTSFLYADNDDLSIFYWVDNGLAFALTAAMDRSPMMDIAQLVYQQSEGLNR
jgi:anti-sigma factor RsiW